MIDLALAHVLGELNDYINLRSQIADRVVACSLFDSEGKANTKGLDKIVMSLVNVAEEHTYRSQKILEKRSDGVAEYVRPPIKVNLYVLFIANLNDYPEAMKALGQVMSFFQHRPFFDDTSISELRDRPARMSFELQSLSFEQLNHLWGALGSKYVPSALYKVGILDVRDRQLEAEVPPVEDFAVNV